MKYQLTDFFHKTAEAMFHLNDMQPSDISVYGWYFRILERLFTYMDDLLSSSGKEIMFELFALMLIFAPSPVGEQCIVMSVCLSIRDPHIQTSPNFPCMLPVALLWYVMFFRFCGWRHVFFHNRPMTQAVHVLCKLKSLTWSSPWPNLWLSCYLRWFVEMDGRIFEVEFIGLRRSQEHPYSVKRDMDSGPHHPELVRTCRHSRNKSADNNSDIKY